MEIFERLKEARTKAGYAGPQDAAKAMGMNRYTYTQHESGLRGIKQSSAERYAAFFRVDLAWLLTGKGRSARKGTIPILGYVGAGTEVYPIDDHAKGAALDYVEIDGLPDNSAALIVKGDSMYPFEDGWIIFFNRQAEGVPNKCVNQLCVVRLANDGPTLVKKLRRGSKEKHFNLESWNAPLREDEALDWATPVLSIRPA